MKVSLKKKKNEFAKVKMSLGKSYQCQYCVSEWNGTVAFEKFQRHRSSSGKVETFLPLSSQKTRRQLKTIRCPETNTFWSSINLTCAKPSISALCITSEMI